MSALLKAGHYIDGQWHSGGPTYAVRNPATGEVIIEVPRGGAEETNAAIAAAERALPAWRALLAKERAARLRRWAELMLASQDELARLLSREQGKPLAEAKGEVAYAASFLEWFAEEAKRVYGDVIPSPKADARIVVTKQPVGVVAAITPWNFPLAMVTRKVGPALAAGCTLILKPSEETPLSAFALAVLAEQAGIPAGVFNIVSGDGPAIGGALQASGVVRKLSFTGSTRTGKLLMRQAADTLKKVSLELGGNAPFIVFADADLDAAVRGAMASKFRNTGQTCVCVNRFYVQDEVYEAFTAKLAEAVRALRVGNALEGETEQGPLINEAALAKVEQHVGDALEKGARLLCGGQRHALGGTFYEPTVLAEANAGMLIAGEETFGPVAACFRFRDEAEALRLANDTPYGLSAYFYSRDIGRVWRMAEGLEAGMVGINEGIISTEVAPFGGIKESGLGREGSKYGLDDYLEIKYLLLGGLSD
ncbi:MULTISPECIES: NAD-dependent succinate-semialdehyde dehydrogenase [unclassified Pseudomonas]|uniref:NAD-dependent succinate-semialdehyde dehydrogenase n=1 Tax=unclassified Pseudomonas TaxID=196821 RepID=UPI0002A3A760|nr:MULTISPECIES: NAD-dependent succinate-semialdehyde dehydrogenase [unclassified Pseudomonas]MBB1605318.1 succinate-semialdehyde dehydrogenase (NADP(+)) [Pseudomonas sp. UMC76]MBB1641263.1 succinate-semialdehyde dehydrogenase (NADP(+)) [Pseudomonas sp. UME83]NTX89219.1 NAD-dependent succinate-semialdehyde dehydrogenase [Pseudomonas sp. UMA643]NTY20081.1 NAD-dependent succinate-semialdehyde dehydrogenase [Pseudomonas sp. UMC3103]NTY24090.1 NAD-dependent succinate-semialdehyde dehydrogenase [Ps